MKEDIQNIKDIKLLVDSFYSTARESDIIGHFFSELKFKEHLPVICSFWNDILFGSNEYKGNPMSKHLALHARMEMEGKHFQEWLSLWNQAVNHHFIGKKAEEAVARAQSIAGIMQHKVNQ